MTDSLDIATVARLTGLSSRALRFYEARGLVKPLRSASGRRYYGAAELERVHQIMTLKRAGLTLAQIDTLSRHRSVDIVSLVDAQLESIAAAVAELGQARTLLLSVKSRIERSEPIDVATFCSLIRHGEQTMSTETQAWKNITDQYLTEDAKADFAEAMPKMGSEMDRQDYAAKWKELGDRIKAAMPLSPTSEAALGFVREWFALLAPFTKMATPEMWNGAQKIYANMDDWQRKSAADPGFDKAVWEFIGKATQMARDAGHDIGPMPPWMSSSNQG